MQREALIQCIMDVIRKLSEDDLKILYIFAAGLSG